MKQILSVLAIVLCLGVAITNCQVEELGKTEQAKISEHNLRIERAYRVFVSLHNKYGKFVRHGIILEMCDQKDLASLFELSGSEVNDFVDKNIKKIFNSETETLEFEDLVNLRLLVNSFWEVYKIGFKEATNSLIVLAPKACKEIKDVANEKVEELQKLRSELNK
jgi:hypothetical protein